MNEKHDPKEYSIEIGMEVPKDLRRLFDVIQTELPILLDDVLFGIYIYGSLSYGNFEEHGSDVDVMVITERKLTKSEVKKLERWHRSDSMKNNRWAKRLEMDYILKEDAISETKNTIESVRFAGGNIRKESQVEGVSIDLKNIRDCGISLFGQSPSEFIPEISEEMLFRAQVDKFNKLKNKAEEWIKIDLWNQMFVVVQMCRTFYALQHGSAPISKKDAALWCSDNLPEEFRPMVKIALSKIDDRDGPLEKTITNNLPAFTNCIDSLIESLENARNKEK